MKHPYIVGELRKCADCPAMFPRGPRRRSYCPTCYQIRKKAWNAKSNAKAKEAKKPAPTLEPLPREAHASHYKAKRPLEVYRTYKTPLPYCAVCHAYKGMCGHGQVIYG